MCRLVARKANANFFYASQILKTPKREFFYATYAAMRIIDDVVDEKYDVVFCNIDTLKGQMKVMPEIFVKMWSRMGLVETTREKMTLEYERFFSNVLVTTNMTVFSNKD